MSAARRASAWIFKSAAEHACRCPASVAQVAVNEGCWRHTLAARWFLLQKARPRANGAIPTARRARDGAGGATVQ